jgi:protein-L-isoaspartate(D-aspartate) O-methyltransferase
MTRSLSFARRLGLLWAQVAAACAQQSADAPPKDYAAERSHMVEWQIAGRDIRDQRVLEALRTVPRHLFVSPAHAPEAYEDRPLPIGHGQTISQPYIVALMSQLARPAATDRVLEIGTGSGYQAAVISKLAAEVYTIEIVEPLAREAEQRLKELGYSNVTVRAGDGFAGWPEKAPFDIILVTAAPEEVPAPLIEQLKPGGRMVVPVGPVFAVQELRLITKDSDGKLHTKTIAPVRFVPLQRNP